MNITATDGPLIAQYHSYTEQGNTVQANEILSQIPQGTQKIIKATDVNKWTQAILALERFYISDIEPYIQQQQEDWQAIVDQFSYQGEWASGITYVKNNFVSYTSGGVTMLYIATGNPPTGTAPTNATYWRPLTIQGQQGQSGEGLAYRENWDAGTQYNANDAVTYEGALWMALQVNQNITPGTNASYWQKVIEFEATTYPIQDTEPTNLEAGSLWFNTSTPISSLAVGSIVKVNENGSPVNYMIVQQGNPDTSMYDASCNGTWLLRVDCSESKQWNNTNNNDYANSTINSYLNSTWVNEYDSGMQGIIKQVKIPYVNGTGSSGSVASGSSGLSCKIFLLSGREVGFSTSDNPYFPNDGAKLSYFESGTGSSALNKRIAKLNGSAAIWWLRSLITNGTGRAWLIYSNGSYGSLSCSNSYGIRPCFIIPSTTSVDSDNNIITS